MTVCVVGLGKIGLPLAVQLATRAEDVVGADIDRRVTHLVNAGIAPFPGEAQLAEKLVGVVATGRLRATTDTEAAVRASDTVVVVVPLVIDAGLEPDFDAMDAATAAVARGLNPGTLVCFETTLPVGTTRCRLTPVLESLSGTTAGTDLFVCFSPERVFSGRVFADLRRYPKLVGGVDPESTKRGVAFYESALEFDDRPDLARPNGVWAMPSAEAAELAKLAETTYRNVNIAFANELAMVADRLGIDVESVIEGSNSQPFSHIHRPGIAVGGHCIPVYPHLYLRADPAIRLPALAIDINESMPAYAVSLLVSLVGDLDGLRVAVLGAAYRGGVKETAFSGVFPTVAALRSRSATVTVHDPLYDDGELAEMGFTPHHLGEPVDAVIVQADHDEYRTLSPADLPGVAAVVDGRGVLDPARWTSVPQRRIGDGRSQP